jgi:hypothetical protein
MPKTRQPKSPPIRKARKPAHPPHLKPKTCKCSMRNDEHEVTCPAFDVDAELAARRPTKATRYAKGRATATEPPPEDDDADEADDEPERYAAVVDGREAVIDATRPPPQPRLIGPTHDDLMDALLVAQDVLEKKSLAAKTAKDEQKVVQATVDGIVARLAQSWRDRNQLELPLAGALPVAMCASCGDRPGNFTMRNGALWCTTCVQTAIAEPQADAPPDVKSPPLDAVIRALAEAIDVNDATAEHEDAVDRVRELLHDDREPAAIRADVMRIATAFGYCTYVTAPYVRKSPNAQGFAAV